MWEVRLCASLTDMPAPQSKITIIDGSIDFSQGVQSNVITTIASQINPNGLPRNALSWMVNATIRDGGIRPRSGWQPLGHLGDNPGLYQGGAIYDPIYNNAYLMYMMDGILYAIFDVDNPVPVDLTFGNPALKMPATNPQAFFCQAEQFMIIQAGDYSTLPLFWDGATLSRSNGIIGVAAVPPAAPPWNELPAAGTMDYYMGRIWYAQGRTWGAGDIVSSHASGTALYDYRDSVLRVTENPLMIGGDNFTVPSNAGNIRGIAHSANLNSLLGQGTIYAGTRRAIYALQVPVTRTDWINADTNNQPIQYAVALSTGFVNDRSIVRANGDLFFQTVQPSIQSLAAAVRNFQQWGNVPVSVNENRIMAFNDRSLLWASSGVFFDNRVLQTAIPKLSPNGVLHPALVPLNFDALSTLNNQLPPAWEGQLTGIDILQLFTSDFGGRERCYALMISRLDGSLQLWELTVARHTDNGDNRIDWIVEFPAYTWGREFGLKELMTLELWLDDIRGTVEFSLDYRPDSDACFYPWHTWQICAARDSNEKLNPQTSPYPTPYGPGYKSTITMPHPPLKCASFTGRPAYMGYQFQPRLTIHGWCRIRGLFLHAIERDRELFAGKVC